MDSILSIEENILHVLTDIGLSNFEASIYIFLAKKSPKKGKELLDTLKISRPNLYRCLRDLQNMGLIYTTLERPARFYAYPFETVCKIAIKRKLTEVASLQKNQQELSSHLDSSERRDETKSITTKTMIIEGEKNIYRKAVELVNDTKGDSLAIVTVKDLISANNFGLYDTVSTHPPKSNVSYRYLTYVYPRDITSLTRFMEKTRSNSNLRGRAFKSKITSAPRLIISDDEAIIILSSPLSDAIRSNNKVMAFWTDSPLIVCSLRNMFEYLWQDSINLEKKVAEVETGVCVPQTEVCTDPEFALKKYKETLNDAKKEVLAVFSKNDIDLILQNQDCLQAAVTNGATLKILAPFSPEINNAIKRISPHTQLRVSKNDYLTTLIIDNTHVLIGKGTFGNFTSSFLDLMIYSNDTELIAREKNMINDLWTISS